MAKLVDSCSLVDDLFNAESQPVAPQAIAPAAQLRDESRLIEIDKLIPSTKNRKLNEEYVADLARNIRINGLLQYPIVKPKGDGSYEILAGHHRIAACKLNKNECDDHSYDVIRCIVKGLDDVDSELIMLDTNLKNNAYNAYDMMMAIGRKEELLRIKKQAKIVKGNLKDIIMEDCSLQKTQIKTYLAIYKKCCLQVKQALETEKITVSQAYNLCKFNQSEQIEKLNALGKKKNSSLPADFDKAYRKLLHNYYKQVCQFNDLLFNAAENELTDQQKDLKTLLHATKNLINAMGEKQ